jgi:site-specific recombinase
MTKSNSTQPTLFENNENSQKELNLTGLDSFTAIKKTVEFLRPAKPHNWQEASYNIIHLTKLIEANETQRNLLKDHILYFFQTKSLHNLLSQTGILSNKGFFSEVIRIIGNRILPQVPALNDIEGIINLIFKEADAEWVANIPNEIWGELLTKLELKPISFTNENDKILTEIFNIILILSMRIANIGHEPALYNRIPELQVANSPFLKQNLLVGDFIQHCFTVSTYRGVAEKDILEIEKTLEECEKYIDSIRENRDKYGISLAITFEMRRMTQIIQRLRDLLHLISAREYDKPFDRLVSLFKSLFLAESEKNSLNHQFTQNTNLLAFQITEHARKTGEHYITSNKAEYFDMLKAAAGGGLIVSFLVFTKLLIYFLHPAPITTAFLYGLNYALGFIVIHLLHFTVATKQPAMTATAIASALDNAENQKQQIKNLAAMIIRIIRSQFIALFGNVLVVFPMALGLAWLYFFITGEHFVNLDKAQTLIAELHPLHSLSLYFAGVTGIYLFISGLLSGLHDNMCVFYKIPQRIENQPLLKKMLKLETRKKIANYIRYNLGGIAGNFYLGMFLGFSGTVGMGFGIPSDIRHITFSAGNFGVALIALNFDLSLRTVLVTTLGILSIGFINLLVSFTLALYVAVKSRNVSFSKVPALFGRLFVELLRNPLAFIIPPKE